MSKLAETIIKIEESFRAKPYYCSEHYPTIGYGEKVGDKYAPLPNLIRTKDEATKFVRDKIDKIIYQLATAKPLAWSKCNEQRKAILISMTYQLGFAGLMAFQKMWACIERSDFEGAAKEMVNSRWFVQTKNRALRHSQQMRVGSTHIYYLTDGQFH